MSLCVKHTVTKESFTAVQCALHTHFHTEPPGDISVCGLYWNQAQTQTTVNQTQEVDQDSCLCRCTTSTEMSCTKCKWILNWMVPYETEKCMLHSCYPFFIKHTSSLLRSTTFKNSGICWHLHTTTDIWVI